MPEATYAVTLTVKVDDDLANVNEILHAVATVRKEVGVKLAQAILEWLDAEVRDRLCGSERAAKKGLGAHRRKGDASRRCRCRSFVKAGYRFSRTLKTEVGMVMFPVGQVRCGGCGKKLAPLIDVLDLSARQGHSDGVERAVVEAVNKTSFARGVETVAGLAGVPASKSAAHRWVAGQDLPDLRLPPIEQVMADGTRFKSGSNRGRFKRADLRVAIGVTADGGIAPIGVWSGKTWAEIGSLLKRRLGHLPKPAIFLGDGEPALSIHLAGVAEREQRAHYQFFRDFAFGLWKDGLTVEEWKPLRGEAQRILAVEIPETDWEAVLPIEKEALRNQVTAARDEFQAMIDAFEARGYRHGAEYLRNAKDRLFGRIDLWLETGIIAPKSTGVLEEILREIGRRVKKLGWNWSDHGVTQQAKMILLRRYSPSAWDAYWQQRLDLRGRCTIEITHFQRAA